MADINFLNILYTILSFLFIFSVIVIGHEGGHFLVAKVNGIHVVEFTIGIGPKLLHFMIGDTEYSVRAFPFGGACIFENPDEMDEEEEKKEKGEKLKEDLEKDKQSSAFNDASVFARIATVIAGPLFNILLAYVLSLFIVFFCGETNTVIGDVDVTMPAYEAGLRAGDEILKINGESVFLFSEIQLLSYLDTHEDWSIEYKRGDEVKETVLTPVFVSEDRRIIGITGTDKISCDNLKMFKYSYLEVRYWLKATFKSLKMLFTGRLTKDDLSGPVGIAKVTYDTIEETIDYGVFTVILNVINLVVLLSVNLGIMNLLPFPVLDGGRLLILFIEAVTKKKIPRKVETAIQMVGVVCLLMLTIFVLINDITKFFR